MALTDPHEKSFDRDAALGQSVTNGVPMISAPPLSKMGLIIFLFLHQDCIKPLLIYYVHIFLIHNLMILYI